MAPQSLLSVYVNTLEKSNQPAGGPGAREGVARKGRGARGAAGDGRTQEGRGGGAAGGRGGCLGSPGAEPELFNSRLEGFEDLPALPGLGRVVLALHRSPGLAAGAVGLPRSCGLAAVWESRTRRALPWRPRGEGREERGTRRRRGGPDGASSHGPPASALPG